MTDKQYKVSPEGLKVWEIVLGILGNKNLKYSGGEPSATSLFGDHPEYGRCNMLPLSIDLVSAAEVALRKEIVNTHIGRHWGDQTYNGCKFDTCYDVMYGNYRSRVRSWADFNKTYLNVNINITESTELQARVKALLEAKEWLVEHLQDGED